MESFDKLTEIYIEDLKKTPAYKTYRDKSKKTKRCGRKSKSTETKDLNFRKTHPEKSCTIKRTGSKENTRIFTRISRLKNFLKPKLLCAN